MKIEDLSDKELQKYYNLYKMGINKTKRFESHKIFNLDVKFAYHLIRLLDEVEQILSEGDLDLERNREQLKYIRNGFYTENEIIKLAQDKEKALEIVNSKSTAVPYKIQHRKISTKYWNQRSLAVD